MKLSFYGWLDAAEWLCEGVIRLRIFEEVSPSHDVARKVAAENHRIVNRRRRPTGRLAGHVSRRPTMHHAARKRQGFEVPLCA
jgi:hypothetical protein